MNFATLTLTAAKREIKRLAYANKKVQVFSFLSDATAWLVVLYVLCKSYLRPRKISSEKKDFYFSIFKTFSFSIYLAFVMLKVIFCQNFWKLKRNKKRNKTKKMLIFPPKTVVSRKGTLKFKHFSFHGNYLKWTLKY